MKIDFLTLPCFGNPIPLSLLHGLCFMANGISMMDPAQPFNKTIAKIKEKRKEEKRQPRDERHFEKIFPRPTPKDMSATVLKKLKSLRRPETA